ncbi:uncharacterized protein DS421_13g441700 [Arachis hypogaea]|nr:uncharacterized protein DS421_13g441700 [Arachis hypogaea]
MNTLPHTLTKTLATLTPSNSRTKEQKGKREEGENRRGKRRGRKGGGAGGHHCHCRRRGVIARKARTEGERAAQGEGGITVSCRRRHRRGLHRCRPWRFANRGKTRRSTQSRHGKGRRRQAQPPSRPFVPPFRAARSVAGRETERAWSEKWSQGGSTAVGTPLLLLLLWPPHLCRQETPRRDVCCCVVPVAVWMYLNQVVVATGAELFLSLSRSSLFL